jgi:hypothetical protein
MSPENTSAPDQGAQAGTEQMIDNRAEYITFRAFGQQIRTLTKRCLPWWSALLGQYTAQRLYDAPDLGAL